MDRSHHKVLAQVSLSYSLPEGRFPRVTHPCATKPEGFVRLACVRHAASVRSEPGSNSQVHEQSMTGKPATDRQGAVPKICTTSTSIHRAPQPKLRADEALWYVRTYRNGVCLTTVPAPLSALAVGRRPHVPSSKPTMRKSKSSLTPETPGKNPYSFSEFRWRPRGALPAMEAAFRPSPSARQHLFFNQPIRTKWPTSQKPQPKVARINQTNPKRSQPKSVNADATVKEQHYKKLPAQNPKPR